MHYSDYKTILSPKNGMNVYRGCSHGCIYCDSRSACYQFTHDFEDIEVKRNAVQIFEEQLKRRRKPCMISTGAMTDPYIPLEKELQITRQCLALIERYGFGINILTKSNLILRDLDLLQAIHHKTKCVVEITLTTHDEKLCSILEPNVASTKERFAVLEILRDMGIPTVVWLTPILPFINDTKENLVGILDYCIRAKIYGIIHFSFGTTMREGSRDYFYQQLDNHFPGMKKRYQKTFGNNYICPSPNHRELSQYFKKTCQSNNIICNDHEVFEYMHTFETKEKQMTIFDLL